MAVQNIKKNPLFKALGGSVTPKSSSKKVNARRGGKKVVQEVKKLQNNKLAEALGVVQGIDVKNGKSFKNTRISKREIRSKERIPALESSKQAGKQFQFKDASKVPFLRVDNLVPGVSETDIGHIMSQFGAIARVVTTAGHLKRNDKRVVAEIFYVNDDSLARAHKALNDSIADGRKLKVGIFTTSSIIHSEMLWNHILEDVQLQKRQLISNNKNRNGLKK